MGIQKGWDRFHIYKARQAKLFVERAIERVPADSDYYYRLNETLKTMDEYLSPAEEAYLLKLDEFHKDSGNGSGAMLDLTEIEYPRAKCQE